MYPRYVPSMYLNKYTSTNIKRASNGVPQVIYQVPQTHASSMLLNVTRIQHNKPQVCTIIYN
jgi:hypothetical protein